MRVRELEVTITTPEFLANIMGWTVGLLIERERTAENIRRTDKICRWNVGKCVKFPNFDHCTEVT